MTTPDLELSDRFVRYLRAFAIGEKQAQTAVTICAALGLEPTETNRRTLRACSQQAVRAGHLVCAGQRGYFVPACPSEVLVTTRRLRSEAGELWKRARLVDDLATERFDLREAPDPPRVRPALFALLEAEA